jgi:hypothetical protein
MSTIPTQEMYERYFVTACDIRTEFFSLLFWFLLACTVWAAPRVALYVETPGV